MSYSDQEIIEFIRWWEKRRKIYNLILLVVGIIGLAVFFKGFFNAYVEDSVFGILWFAFFANVFFTGGWVVPLLLNVWRVNKSPLGRDKLAWFYVGIIISVLLEMAYILACSYNG